jgi:hypothetical protein
LSEVLTHFLFYIKVFWVWWSCKEEINKQCSKYMRTITAAGHAIVPVSGLWGSGAAQGE